MAHVARLRAPKHERHENPIVFLDVRVGASAVERLVIELRADVVPATCENFRRLCTGETRSSLSGKRRHFARCPFHRVVKDKFCQSGDFVNHDGSGGESTFDELDDAAVNNSDDNADNNSDAGGTRSLPRASAFKDENFILRHTGAGVLSMANTGPDTNTSQFYLHFAPAPSLDNKHVVFGSLLGDASFRALAHIERVATEQGDPKQPVAITASGQLYPH